MPETPNGCQRPARPTAPSPSHPLSLVPVPPPSSNPGSQNPANPPLSCSTTFAPSPAAWANWEALVSSTNKERSRVPGFPRLLCLRAGCGSSRQGLAKAGIWAGSEGPEGVGGGGSGDSWDPTEVALRQGGTGGFWGGGGGCKSCGETSPNNGEEEEKLLRGAECDGGAGGGGGALHRWEWRGGTLMWGTPGGGGCGETGGLLGTQWRQRGEQPMRGAAGEVMHRDAAAIGPGAAARAQRARLFSARVGVMRAWGGTPTR